jgi:hypothetical protein
MEQRVLESRFLAKDLVPIDGGGKKDISEADVEMILIRGKTSQIGAVGDQWLKLRGTAQDEIHMNMDMAMSKELAIFLHLNDAVDGAGAMRQVSSDTWSTPGAFRIKFRYAFNTKTSPKMSQTGISIPKIELPAVDNAGPSKGRTAKLALNAEDKTKQGANSQPEITMPPSSDANWAIAQGDLPSQVLIIVRHLKENVVFPAVKPRAAN